MKKIVLLYFALVVFSVALDAKPSKSKKVNPPIYIAFLWHMHQPIYWPYETVNQTDQNARYGYSVTDIHNQRIGPYTTWPKNAVQKGIDAGLSHAGAQVSFSGSLIENLNNLESGGNGNFSNWKSSWNTIKNQTTSLGNPRLDMVGFGYHHPLMGLIDYLDTRKQIQAHKQILSTNFPGTYSKGIFPPENAFSPRMIPALVAEGIQWVLVDNVHFDRTCQNYPFSTQGNLYEPNKADILNPDPNDWVQLNGLWAPTRNSAKWGRQPHYVEYIDPTTGTSTKVIVVPADRYMGNEDGRGGFGALNYENVMSQLESYNTDPNHPILIVLHHDGDNYGGGSDAYYNSNFQGFVNWVQSNPTRFVCTTIQDYLDMFPPSPTDVIQVESGSWSGADNGDPEFKKWLGDPDGTGYSPDRNSWGVVTAAKNIVMTAEQINSGSSNTKNAWKYMLNAEASDYWYWDGSQNGIWDSHPTRASNQAITYAQPVISSGTDLTGPTIFQPQREPYNPGATEWGINQPSDMTVWSYVYDVHGLKSVTLKYRTDVDGVNSTSSIQNETYAGGSEVTAWTEVNMTGVLKSSTTNPQPISKAKEYSYQITGQNNVLLDYYVEAVDSFDNVSKSAIQHVWIGANSGGGGGGTTGVSWTPVTPTNNDTITITVAGATQGAYFHWGVNNNGSAWQTPNAVYRPAGSSLFGAGPAVQSPMSGPDGETNLTIKIGPFNNAAQVVSKIAFVIHYNNNTWDNNSGQDYHITLPDTTQPTQTFTMDGSIDASANLVATNAGINLYLGWNNSELYMATQSAQQQGGDVFIFVSDSQSVVRSSPWAKAGSVSSWDAFLANESGNNYNAWADNSGSVGNSAGTYLEGKINVQQEFGSIPAKLYIAVGKYQTDNNGALTGQVPAGNGNGNIEPTELYEFDYTFPVTSVPNAPVLSSPANGASNQATTLNIQWNTVNGATGYQVQTCADTSFVTTLVDDSSLTGTSIQLSGLSYSTTYYWRVRAKNSMGWGAWSTKRYFATQAQPQPPNAPVLVYPLNNEVNQAIAFTFRWNKSTGATGYTFIVSEDSTFTTSLINDTTLTDTLKVVNTLAYSTRYYWIVKAKNSVGWSSWSTKWNFGTMAEPQPPTAPVLVFPTDVAMNQTVPLRVRWNVSSGAISYGIVVSIDSNFVSSVLSDTALTDTSKLLNSLSYTTQYYWKVRAKNNVGWSAYSSRWSFTTEPPPPPPGIPNLVFPANADTNQPKVLALRWNMAETATTYHIVFASDSLFATPIINDTTVTDTTQPVSSLLIHTDYFWKVRAHNISGWSDWSTVWKFTTGLPIFSCTTTELQFDSVYIGTSKHDSVIITNNGVYPLEVYYATPDSPVFTVLPANGTIQPFSSKTFYVTFTPVSELVEQGIISFTHNSPDAQYDIPVKGIGVKITLVDVDVPLLKDWNLVSLPVMLTNDSVAHVYPDAVSSAFLYNSPSGYLISPILGKGKGYWLKYNTTTTVPITGVPVVEDTIAVKVGWNLIGSISTQVSALDVSSIPPEIIASQFYSFVHGYINVTTIEPGLGYWVKVNQDGVLILRQSGLMMGKTRIK